MSELEYDKSWSTQLTAAGLTPLSNPINLRGVLKQLISSVGGPFAPLGLTGATAASRYVGATTSGAPASGTFAVGDFVIDQTGAVWICITAGSPGTWITAGSGIELAEADLSSDYTSISTSLADVPGLAVTFTAPSRPFVLDVTLPLVTVAATADYVTFTLTDSANTIVSTGFSVTGSATTACPPFFLRAHLPNTGTGSYAITPGNSYTFKLRAASNAGAATISTGSGVHRPVIRAVVC